MRTSFSMSMYTSKILNLSNRVKSLTALFPTMVTTINQAMNIMTYKGTIGNMKINKTM